MNNLERYPLEVFWSDEDEGFIATAPDLPGCSAFGSSGEEALAELKTAMLAWIEAAQKAGNPIPAPSRRAEESQYSGKFLARVPKSLHRQLAEAAKQESVSLNQYVVFLLGQACAARSMAYAQPYVASATAFGQLEKSLALELSTSAEQAYLGFEIPKKLSVVNTGSHGFFQSRTAHG